MCNTIQDCKPVANGLLRNGQMAHDAFPDLVQKINPNSAIPGHCLMTGEPMSHEHMYPPGLTPRHMTNHSYKTFILRNNNWQCPICSQALNDGKLNMQKAEPREMKHHHCDKCWDYHLLLAGVVHNVPEALRVVQTRQTPQLQQMPAQVYPSNTALPYVPAGQPAIAYEPATTVDDFMGQIKTPSKIKQLVRRLKS